MFNYLEKVLFRKDKKKHYDREYYYIIFPCEDTGSRNLVACIPCCVWSGNSIPYGVKAGFMVESHDFMDIEYYHKNTVAVKKGTEIANKLLGVVKMLCPNTEIKVMERLRRG